MRHRPRLALPTVGRGHLLSRRPINLLVRAHVDEELAELAVKLGAARLLLPRLDDEALVRLEQLRALRAVRLPGHRRVEAVKLGGAAPVEEALLGLLLGALLALAVRRVGPLLRVLVEHLLELGLLPALVQPPHLLVRHVVLLLPEPLQRRVVLVLGNRVLDLLPLFVVGHRVLWSCGKCCCWWLAFYYSLCHAHKMR